MNDQTPNGKSRVPKDTMLGGADGVTLSGGQAWSARRYNFTVKIHPKKLAWTLNMICFQSESPFAGGPHVRCHLSVRGCICRLQGTLGMPSRWSGESATKDCEGLFLR